MIQKHITWVEISKQAIQHNISQFKKIIPQSTSIMAVVKSNGYGHGMVQTAKIAASMKSTWIGTVNLNEALELRKKNIRSRILVLSYFDPLRLNEAIKRSITLTVYGYKAAKTIDTIAARLKKRVPIHFKIDTGTSRLGLLPEESVTVIKKISALKHIFVEGVFTHFADAENPNQKVTNRQINQFNNVIKDLSNSGIEIPIKHCACSAATILNKMSHLDVVRIGISLYGLYSIESNGGASARAKKRLHLKPALSWKSKILQVKTIPARSSIGYGQTFKAKKRMTIALIPVGYWDGLDRKASNKGSVLVRGQRCKIRGRICMNLTVIDVTHIKNVRAGDVVTLIGTSGKAEISADELADITDTINYEVVTRINPLIPRIYN